MSQSFAYNPAFYGQAASGLVGDPNYSMPWLNYPSPSSPTGHAPWTIQQGQSFSEWSYSWCNPNMANPNVNMTQGHTAPLRSDTGLQAVMIWTTRKVHSNSMLDAMRVPDGSVTQGKGHVCRQQCKEARRSFIHVSTVTMWSSGWQGVGERSPLTERGITDTKGRGNAKSRYLLVESCIHI